MLGVIQLLGFVAVIGFAIATLIDMMRHQSGDVPPEYLLARIKKKWLPKYLAAFALYCITSFILILFSAFLQ